VTVAPKGLADRDRCLRRCRASLDHVFWLERSYEPTDRVSDLSFGGVTIPGVPPLRVRTPLICWDKPVLCLKAARLDLQRSSSTSPDCAAEQNLSSVYHSVIVADVQLSPRVRTRSRPEFYVRMSGMPTCSVVLPTRNRCESLRETLSALAAVTIPKGWTADLTVVDNGSTDATAGVVAQARFVGWSVRHLFEPEGGLSRARNAGIRTSEGEVVLFIDDDMRPPEKWLEGLALPIITGRAAATVSQFKAGRGRDRPWLTDADRAMLITERTVDSNHPFLVASFAVSRDALERCGGFEEELGAGGPVWGGEDILLTLQLRDRGLTVVAVPEVVVEHWFDVRKLNRADLDDRAAEGSRSEAWIAYHWFGRDPRPSFLKAPLLRLLKRGREFAWHDQMRIESRRPRKFAQVKS
jgi:glycosyltransferase involved in cell wall biosynthesis